MAQIRFTKAVASGNDFIIIDNRDNKFSDDFSSIAKTLCKRKLSVGSDGLLILEDSKNADLKMRIFNPDGSEVTMCGNGARCTALFAYLNKWCSDNLKIQTEAGILEATVHNEKIRLRMTDPNHIRLDNDLGLGNTIFKAHFIDTGVPHVVHFLQDDVNIEGYPVREMGQKVRYHKLFEPEGTNANFAKVLSENKIRLRTYERGVEDETLACGTGAVASAIVSYLVNGTRQPVEVLTTSGDILNIYFSANNKKIHNVYLEGSAKIVYEGEVVI